MIPELTKFNLKLIIINKDELSDYRIYVIKKIYTIIISLFTNLKKNMKYRCNKIMSLLNCIFPILYIICEKLTLILIS